MNKYKDFIIIIIIVHSMLFLAGCGSFNYYSTKETAEEAMLKGNLQKAKSLFALIYKHEKTNKKSPDHAQWAYYRLGVIHELLGKVRLARGFYWGDQMKKGFYNSTKKITWYTKYSWERLDGGELPRSLKEILDFEKKGIPRNVKIIVKKKINIPSKPVVMSYTASDHKFTRIFNRSLTPPPSNSPEPFKIFH